VGIILFTRVVSSFRFRLIICHNWEKAIADRSSAQLSKEVGECA
jgi:hypothetical protein